MPSTNSPTNSESPTEPDPNDVGTTCKNAAVQHDRTTRPTVRLLHELNDGWSNSFQPRAISDERWEDIQPLSHLDHPILAKCRTALGENAVPTRTISCSQDLHLIEIHSSQWRAGVWTADDGTYWTLAAGLAKGGHEDRDDFYETLKRQCSTPEGRQALLPTELDWNLLKRETAARLLSEWELRSGRSMSTPTGGITQQHCPCHNSAPTPPFKDRPTEQQTRTAGNSGTQYHHRGRNRRYMPVIHRTEQTQLRIGTQTGIPSTDMHRPTRTRLGQIFRYLFRNGG